MIGGLLVDLVDFGEDGTANPFEFHSTILKPDLERHGSFVERATKRRLGHVLSLAVR